MTTRKDMDKIKIDEWAGMTTFCTEATAADGSFLSLYAGPVADCPWKRWLWTVDTQAGAGEHELRPIAMGIAYSKEEAIAAAEEAARQWLRPTPRLEAIS